MTDVRAIYEPFIEGLSDSGDNHCRGTCPCPKRSKRAFYFSTESGYWGCWSCGEHGSIYKFLTEHGTDAETARSITRGIQEDAPTPEAKLRRKQIKVANGHHTLPDYILAAYHRCPVALVDKGFDEELLERYEVGFDTTLNRTTFAVRTKEGALAGVSGRALHDYQYPRYRVYDAAPPQNGKPAGPFFGIEDGYKPSTRDHLYGLHTFWHERAHKKGEYPPIIITEGYKSTLWLRQMGFHYAVGLQGSDMTLEQEKALAAMPGPYVVLLDYEPGKQLADPKKLQHRNNLLRQKRSDDADRIRYCTAIDIALRLRPHGNALVGVYPPGKEHGTAPDDLSREEIQAAVDAAVTPTIATMNLQDRRP